MFEPETGNVANCVYCGRPFGVHDRAVCTSCGGSFHLAMRVDVEIPQECGDVWLNEALEALEFGCNSCLEASGRRRIPAPKRRYRRIDSSKPAALRTTRMPVKRLKKRRDAL
jgi:5-methylcytosine-specific restriction endonuclease McrA